MLYWIQMKQKSIIFNKRGFVPMSLLMVIAGIVFASFVGVIIFFGNKQSTHVAPTPIPAATAVSTPKTSVVATPTPATTVKPTSTPTSTPAPAAAAPSKGATRTIKVLVLRYFPLDSSGSKLDSGITGMNDDLSLMRTKLSNLNQSVAAALSNGSKYHGYADSAVIPSFNISIVDDKEFLKAIPVSTNKIPWNTAVNRPDYKKMLTEDVDICNLVNNSGVTQVWIWGYHYGNIEPAEGNMSMGNNSRSFWNHGSFGDVSNSEQIDDMPLCNKTYVLFNYNYGRGAAEAVEDHTHHIERINDFADSTLWSNFVNPYGQSGGTINHCGWTHFPPNGIKDYDWRNETTVKSDCMDWKPGGGGQVKDVSCHTWYGSGSCADDSGLAFKVWWMQSIPGMGNTLTSSGQALRNWWDFYIDFDEALIKGKRFIALNGSGVMGINSSVLDNLDFSNIVKFIQSMFK